MRISDWSSDVCSSDLHHGKCMSSRHFDAIGTATCQILLEGRYNDILTPDVHYIRLASDLSNISEVMGTFRDERRRLEITEAARAHVMDGHTYAHRAGAVYDILTGRSEEHTSELQSLMRISYDVFCLKKNNKILYNTPTTH